MLKALESAHPAVAGWILDEQGLIREHINVFVNGERGEEETTGRREPTACTSSPRSQEGESMTELLVGTRKGLFALEGEPGGEFEVTARAFAGQAVEYAMRDPRSGRYLASVTSWFYGPKIWVTDDPAGEWEQAAGSSCPRDRRRASRASG